MPSSTVCIEATQHTLVPRPVHVLQREDCFEVSNVDTPPVTTQMVDVLALRNLAYEQNVRSTMCCGPLAVERELAVTTGG